MAGTVAFVGPNADSNCDFDSIQAAMDSGATDIFVSNAMQYNENLIVPSTNNNVLIDGKYTSCSLASIDITVQSAVSGHLSDAPVIIVLASSERKFVTIKNMLLVNGTGAGFIPAGGITMASSNDILNIDNTTVALNEGFVGGGVYIGTTSDTPFEDRPILALSNKSQINNNLSTSDTLGGGGVFCENGSVIIRDNSSIKRNTTEGSGGGIYAFGCVVNEWSGSSENNDAEKGIYENKAKIHGGGIFATQDSTIQIGSASSFSRLFGSVINNEADSDNDGIGDGGGIYTETDEDAVVLLGSLIKGNESGGNGGGIYAQNGSFVSARRQNDTCWSDYKCNQIIDNYASNSNGNGGGMYFTNGGYGIIETAYFEGNRADNGTAIYTTSDPSYTTIQNATFFKNGNNGTDGFSDNNVIMVNNNASINTLHSTFVNNNETVSTFRSQNDSNLTVRATIINSETAESAIRIASSLPVTAECVNTNLPPPVGTDVFFQAITFVDAANGDFHLSSEDNGAIDICIDYEIPIDGEGDERPFNNPDVPNFRGPSDVGADEYTDIIFKNGFEENIN